MKKLILLLLVSISFLGCKDAPDMPDTCVPSSTFGKAYCTTYSMKKMEWKGDFKTEPISKVDDAICFSKSSFLTIWKPYVKDNYRVKKAQKKNLIIDRFRDIRDTYEIK